MAVSGLFKKRDPELVERTLQRFEAQDEWNDIFATKLIDVLDKIDRLQVRAAERMFLRARRQLTLIAGLAIAASLWPAVSRFGPLAGHPWLPALGSVVLPVSVLVGLVLVLKAAR